MKQLFTFLFICCCSFAVLNAQVTLTKESHEFIPGSKHQSQRVEYQSPGESGQNIIWDFSKAETIGEMIKSNSDFEKDAETGIIKVFRHEDQITFLYNISERGNEYLGYENKAYKLLFNKPLLKTQYPQTFGNYIEGAYEGTLSYGADRSYPVSGTYSTHGDATGTIILPNGDKYPVLRVHTTQNIDADGGSASQIDKYLWYAQDVRLPLFVSIQNYTIKKDGTKALRSQESYYSPVLKSGSVETGISNVEKTVAYKVFPNPFQDNIELSYDLPKETLVKIELFDSKGTKLSTLVSQTQSGAVSFTENVSQYTQSQGTYFLKMQFGNQVYTEKLLKK